MKLIKIAILIVLMLVGDLLDLDIRNTRQSLAAAIARPVAASNQLAPAFDLQGLDGKSYHVGGVRDKPLIINFWASWCGPCHEEAPDLKQMYEVYKDELDIYAVNVTKGDRMQDVQGFVKQYELPFPVLLDTKGLTAEQYRLQVVPTSFLLNKEGVLVDVIHVLPAKALEAKIRLLLNKDQNPPER
ncbi:Thiol-disulfide isomerase or thioredoxin [Paenibacillus sp. 1_12]|uniref:TlpA family protein disulfide reductase n=1 Tax=Paenibacillus sp. 1_12 TaxID=1566278 RepID=UPI0008F00296|nr:TlpA disulfide reductase family protein [Paenibacillus sp. 1_12]SFL27342.1 Thiol-disulfide isomerase or thioredoxin [Paenibacillus sp. 1_12]